jgi:hypothetical protein
MAAGDLINPTLGCYQVELRVMLIAEGQSWKVTRGGFTGLSYAAKENVYSLGHDSGSVVGPEFTESLLLSWDVQCNTTTGALAEAALATLETAWAPAGADLALHMYVPGRGHLRCNGRPHGGLNPDRTDVATGTVRATTQFFVPIPTLTVVP